MKTATMILWRTDTLATELAEFFELRTVMVEQILNNIWYTNLPKDNFFSFWHSLFYYNTKDRFHPKLRTISVQSTHRGSSFIEGTHGNFETHAFLT